MYPRCWAAESLRRVYPALHRKSSKVMKPVEMQFQAFAICQDSLKKAGKL